MASRMADVAVSPVSFWSRSRTSMSSSVKRNVVGCRSFIVSLFIVVLPTLHVKPPRTSPEAPRAPAVRRPDAPSKTRRPACTIRLTSVPGRRASRPRRGAHTRAATAWLACTRSTAVSLDELVCAARRPWSTRPGEAGYLRPARLSNGGDLGPGSAMHSGAQKIRSDRRARPRPTPRPQAWVSGVLSVGLALDRRYQPAPSPRRLM
jgi:hypothetical protein